MIERSSMASGRAFGSGGDRHAHGGQPVEGAEPDGEGLPMGAPRVASVLGHQGKGQDRVAGEDHRQLRASRVRRPAPARRRRRTRRRRATAGPGAAAWRAPTPRTPRRRRIHAPASWSVANGSSHSQTGNTRADRIATPDPAVDPQEQAGDGGVGRAAGDALGHDPRPAEEADRPQAVPHDRRHRGDPAGLRRAGAHVAREDEREGQGDGRRGPGEVHGKRQWALVGGGQPVGEGHHRPAQHHGRGRTRRPRGARGDGARAARTATLRLRGSAAGRTPRGRRRARGPPRWERGRPLRSPIRHPASLRRRRAGVGRGRRARVAATAPAEGTGASRRWRSRVGAAVGAGEAVAGAGVGLAHRERQRPARDVAVRRRGGPLDRIGARPEGEAVERHHLAAVLGRACRCPPHRPGR